MQFRITSVASEEAGTKLGTFSVALEKALNKQIGNASLGSIDQFVIVLVAVFDEETENLVFCKRHDKTGSYKHPITSERVKYFSVAVPYSSAKVESANEADLRRDLCAEIIRRIDNPQAKIPKGVDYRAFAEQTKLVLEIYGKADFAAE